MDIQKVNHTNVSHAYINMVRENFCYISVNEYPMVDNGMGKEVADLTKTPTTTTYGPVRIVKQSSSPFAKTTDFGGTDTWYLVYPSEIPDWMEINLDFSAEGHAFRIKTIEQRTGFGDVLFTVCELEDKQEQGNTYD